MIDPAVLAGHGDHRVVLDVQLLLVADAVLALEDRGPRSAKPASRSPCVDLVLGEDVVALLGVEDRRQRLGDELDPALEPAERLAIRRREERDGLGVVPNLATDRDEHGLVVLDRADDVLAGDVRSRRDDDLRPVDVGVGLDGDELRARLGRADRRAVPGAREDEVVGVLRLAGELGRALAPEREARGAARGKLAGVDDEGALDDVRAGRQGAGGHPSLETPARVLSCACEPSKPVTRLGRGARRCRT